MILETIAEFATLKEAAREMAGNWKEWQNFVWFGSDEFPDSDKIMLGYVVGPQSGLTEEANAEVIVETLKPFMGMGDDPAKTADTFGASFHGDRNALKGFMVRVYEGGKITEAFSALFDLSRKLDDEPVLDDEIFQRLNLKYMTKHLNDEVPRICKEEGIEFYDGLVDEVVYSVIEDGEDYETMSDELVLDAIRDVTGVGVSEDD